MKQLTSGRVGTGVLVVVALVIGVTVGAVFFAKSRSNDDGTAAAQDAAPTTTAGGPSTSSGSGDDPSGATGPSAGPGAGSGVDDPDAAQPGPGELVVVSSSNPPIAAYAKPDNPDGFEIGSQLPVVVEMSSTSDLVDGQAINIRVTPAEGSQIFAFHARICQKDADISNTYDFYPTVGAKCIAEPLSAGSDAFVPVAGKAPYQVVEGVFRAGVGTSSYTTDGGESVSITCDRDHPCDLVLELEVPFGYGYLHYPMTFA